ncbi:hypothetical protein ACFVUS_10475 [Nocardia sp. NPDC058058]|uniref:hypothetical protein n=1 Tax=Nocardia sp. NPDC058058 TaxID=3346317 RepID=UPI0036D8930C
MKRSLLVVSQIFVVLLALAIRMFAPGWWLVILVMSAGVAAAVVLAPPLLAGVMAVVFAPSLRSRTVAALVATDLAVLSFALTLPDFTDQYDDHLVPLAALATSDGNVSGSAATTFESIAAASAIAYTIGAVAVVVLSILDHRRAGRVARLGHDLGSIGSRELSLS